MPRVDMGFAIPGLRQFRNELRKMESSLPKELQRANKAFAERLVPAVRSEYAKHYPKPGRREQRRKRAGRTIDQVRARATQTTASIAIGGARYPHMLGQEFGSNRYKQFAPWTGSAPGGRGSAGRFLFPTIREETPQLLDEYGEVMSSVAAGAFPQRGGAR